MERITVMEESQTVVLGNGLLGVRVHLDRGGLDVTYAKREEDVGLWGIYVAAEVDGGWIRTCGRSVVRWEQRGIGGQGAVSLPEPGVKALFVYERREGEPEIALSLRLYEDRPSLWCTLMLRNPTNQILRVGKMRPMVMDSDEGGRVRLGPGWSGAKIYLESNNLCWTGVRDLSYGYADCGLQIADCGLKNPKSEIRNPKSGVGCCHRSGGVGVIYHPFASPSLCSRTRLEGRPAGKMAWLAGFVTVERALGKFVTVYDPKGEEIGQWYAECVYDGLEIPPGEELVSETLYVDFRGDPLNALETYGDAVASANRLPRVEGTPLLWCSWYSHRLTITEQVVLDHARIIAERFKPYGVDLLQTCLTPGRLTMAGTGGIPACLTPGRWGMAGSYGAIPPRDERTGGLPNRDGIEVGAVGGSVVHRGAVVVLPGSSPLSAARSGDRAAGDL